MYKIPSPKGEIRVYDSMEEFRKRKIMKTEQEVEAGLQRLLNRLKQDPLFELRQEFGMLLMKHIDDLTPEEFQRYEELKELLKGK